MSSPSPYLVCDSCTTPSDFERVAKQNFSGGLYEIRHFTIVNHAQQKAMFIDVMKEVDERPDGSFQFTLEAERLTQDGELAADYVLSRQFFKANGDAEPVIVELSDVSVSEFAEHGVALYDSRISQDLKSHTSPFAWAKMAGRVIILLKLKNGSALLFFPSIYPSVHYIYLPKTLLDDQGNAVGDSGIDTSAVTGDGDAPTQRVWDLGDIYGTGGTTLLVCTGERGDLVCRIVKYF